MLELANRYPDRVIVFDSPPLLLTTEAAVLASFMGQIVFVAAADITPQHAVQESLERLGDDKFVGVMLNRCPAAGRACSASATATVMAMATVTATVMAAARKSAPPARRQGARDDARSESPRHEARGMSYWPRQSLAGDPAAVGPAAVAGEWSTAMRACALVPITRTTSACRASTSRASGWAPRGRMSRCTAGAGAST